MSSSAPDTGFAASLDLAALDGSNGFRLDGIDGVDSAALGRRGGGRQRRRHRRPDRRGPGPIPTASTRRARATSSSAPRRLRGEPRSRRRSTARTASASTGSTRTTQRLLGRGGGRRQRRRHRRPDHRGHRGRSAATDHAGESYVVFGTDTGFAASLDLAALDGIERLPPRRDRRVRLQRHVGRGRRATSTATASTT